MDPLGTAAHIREGSNVSIPSTQQRVIDYLRENSNSKGLEVWTGLAHLGKTLASIESAIKALRAKGFVRKTVYSQSAWRYELTASCEKNGFSSVLVDKAVTVSDKAVIVAGMALGRRSLENRPYAPGVWESVRPGADDHKRHLSLSEERA